MIIFDTTATGRTYLTPQWLDRSFVLASPRPLRLRPRFPQPPTTQFRARLARAHEAAARSSR